MDERLDYEVDYEGDLEVDLIIEANGWAIRLWSRLGSSRDVGCKRIN